MPESRDAQFTTSVKICPLCGVQTHDQRCPRDGTDIITTPEIGSIICGHYKFLGVIGAGGMGVVYHCHNMRLDKEVALKTLLVKRHVPEKLLRFQKEAKVLASLQHPNIVSIMDFGIANDGNPFMVMEHFAGQNLAKILDTGHRFSLEEIIEIASQICDATDHAHERAFLHRDLKPSNIMLSSGEEIQIKVLDFGIAKLLAEENADVQALTGSDAAIGSPLYMSPEQSRGEKLDRTSDIYSLGCLIYELLAGAPPFEGASALEIIAKHRSEPPASLQGRHEEVIPQSLESLVLSMLSKDPAQRPRSMARVKEKLLLCMQEIRTEKTAQ